MADGYALTVRVTTRDADAAQSFDALIVRTLEGIREEPGTLVYVSHIPKGEPLVRIFYELYADKAAFQAHEAQSHTREMLRECKQYLVSTEVLFLSEQAGKRPAAQERL